jgi:hypothetical protein
VLIKDTPTPCSERALEDRIKITLKIHTSVQEPQRGNDIEKLWLADLQP